MRGIRGINDHCPGSTCTKYVLRFILRSVGIVGPHTFVAKDAIVALDSVVGFVR